MTCQRHQEIDWAGYLADPRSSEWAGFRTHYLSCAECRREVERWTAVEKSLRELGDGESHPDPEELATFATLPGTLESARRGELKRHVASCDSCRTEVRALQGFDFAPANAAVAADETPSLLGRILGLFSLPAPVLAALALAMLVPFTYSVWQGFRDGGGPTPGPSDVAKQDAKPTDGPDTEDGTVPPLHLAPADPGGQPPAGRIAEGGAVEPPDRRDPGLVAEESAVVVAKLGPTPNYLGPPDSVFWERDVVIRGTTGPRVQALVPEHVAHTSRPSPTLYWYLAEASPWPVEIVVVDDREPEPLLERRLEPPVRAGFHAVSLAEVGVELKTGVQYAWYVGALVDPGRPSRNVPSSGAILRRIPPPALQEALEGALASPAASYAEHGFWYDALDEVSQAIATRPGDRGLEEHRLALLQAAEIAITR